MALLEILTAPDPRLNKKSLPVEKVDQTVRKLMDNLMETLHDRKGLGLAAPQVGIHKRVIVIDFEDQNEISFKPLFMVNPHIHMTSLKTQVTAEACLSVPGQYGEVIRPLEVDISYLDENNHTQRLKTQGLLADCIQHEIDHLDGILFFDHLSSLKRKLIMSRLLKQKKMKK